MQTISLGGSPILFGEHARSSEESTREFGAGVDD
jgi:hypothetical protein